jgi:nucleoside 2-deoxyribosyltransferase
MTRVYLAAMYSRRLEMRALAQHLTVLGYEVTSRWVLEGLENQDQAGAAIMDLEDVDRAGVLVFFAQPHGSANVGGGRHFEFGYAWARGKLCVVVGTQEHVFCHLPGLHYVAGPGELVTRIRELVP